MAESEAQKSESLGSGGGEVRESGLQRIEELGCDSLSLHATAAIDGGEGAGSLRCLCEVLLKLSSLLQLFYGSKVSDVVLLPRSCSITRQGAVTVLIVTLR